MKTVHTIKALQEELNALRLQGKRVGLVPTMGALHAGHASLVKRSVAENDVTVVSDFVNPTQFNDLNDLKKYPRTLEADCRLLEACGVNFVFAPSVEEIYPEPDTRQFSFAPLDTVMEGIYRPGHFNGVCQIVSKLFDIVMPDRAYFGEKDFQQLAIIREMVRKMQFPLEIREPYLCADTQRERDEAIRGRGHQRCSGLASGVFRAGGWQHAAIHRLVGRHHLCRGLHHRLLRRSASD